MAKRMIAGSPLLFVQRFDTCRLRLAAAPAIGDPGKTPAKNREAAFEALIAIALRPRPHPPKS
ncbi:hypothetical protein [Lysobacter gummosus]|uniref:hypothetical protein n=1 Tax=Lysobacter gummosus TaxID=262324 RepID=UPI00363FD0C2